MLSTNSIKKCNAVTIVGSQVALSLLCDSRKGRTDINEHSQVCITCRSSGTAPVDLATIIPMFVPEKPADAFSEVLT